MDKLFSTAGAATAVVTALQVLAATPALLVNVGPSLVRSLTTGAPITPEVATLLLPLMAAIAFPPSRAFIAAQVGAALLPSQLPVTPESIGTTVWSMPHPLQLAADYTQGHGEKPIMFPVGLASVTFTPASQQAVAPPPGTATGPLSNAACPLVPRIVPVHLVRIGSVALAGVPAEFTATAGRRLKTTLTQAFGARVRYVAIAGYCNGYSGYVTTREEYGAQHYEGASTLYGEHTLAAYQQIFATMGSAATGGTLGNNGAPDRLPHVVHL